MEEKKYIEQQEIRDHLYAAYRTAEKFGFELTEDVVLASIDNAIVADVVERKKGHWVSRPWDTYYLRCSVCGGEVGTKWPFCHHCGADMRDESGG